MRSAHRGEPAEAGFELERRFRASAERVFEAWTRPAALREWWCPPGWLAGEIEIDLRVGGNWRIGMRRASDGAAVSIGGIFLDVKPPERLVYTWRWDGAFAEMPETVVTMELFGSDRDTLLVLRHENFADAGIRQQHRSGWIAACDRLDCLVTPARALHARSFAQ